ncbi:hypothetical protein FHU38_000119 [Saccharomonospora amisosensis]|uniref:Uncharacterized protein n=2 Tax=Saccharomonospora TaxID=1851 RepID=H5X653_9PSEU|nr:MULTISPECIES: DUF6355 family natural product biosynthesis protein [Saccharomonospora]EHR53452.1 hypothetical protein SacmaDRAFT_5303 [Saccharomonospora marina XMU15]NIJ09775.1 hypothetical protein [Saccharomonospora amisosensis]
MPASTHPSRHRVRTAATGLALAVLAVGGSFAGTGTASAAAGAHSASSPSAREACGYLGFAKYRHCDGGTGSTVMLDVIDILGGGHARCVGPGISDLQGGIRWRVVDAYWNGGVGCIPGFYGSD